MPNSILLLYLYMCKDTKTDSNHCLVKSSWAQLQYKLKTYGIDKMIKGTSGVKELKVTDLSTSFCQNLASVSKKVLYNLKEDSS